MNIQDKKSGYCPICRTNDNIKLHHSYVEHTYVRIIETDPQCFEVSLTNEDIAGTRNYNTLMNREVRFPFYCDNCGTNFKHPAMI